MRAPANGCGKKTGQPRIGRGGRASVVRRRGISCQLDFSGVPFFFKFILFFYTRYARPAVERRTPPTSEHIVHHGGNGWRETGGRGQVKTEPVTSETVAAAECGDAELLKLVLCSACGCSQCDQKVSFSPKNSCSSI